MQLKVIGHVSFHDTPVTAPLAVLFKMLIKKELKERP